MFLTHLLLNLKKVKIFLHLVTKILKKILKKLLKKFKIHEKKDINYGASWLWKNFFS